VPGVAGSFAGDVLNMASLNGFNPGSTADFIESLLGRGRSNLDGLPPHLRILSKKGQNPKPSLRVQLSPGKASRKKRGR
jgi:hypothetical protein